MKLVKVPFSAGSLGKNIGTEKAPDEIVNELKKMYCSEEGNEIKFEVGEIKVDNSDIEKTMQEIEKTEGDIFLGGDHSITYGLFKGFSKKNKNAGLLVFDAHPDCMENFKVTHEDFINVLISEGILKKENLVLVGLRSWDKQEIEWLKKNKIKFFTSKDIFNNTENVCDSVMEMCRNFGSLYLSIDIDVVDPAFAPGTGYLEPGGITSRELIYFIQRIKMLKNLKRADLVEINPDKDVNNITVRLGAKIIGEFL